MEQPIQGVHLAGLLVGIAHSVMCMKRAKKKPPLIYCGSSDCGKTSIMDETTADARLRQAHFLNTKAVCALLRTSIAPSDNL